MGLATKNQISIWLLTDKGYEKFEKQYGEDYFLEFSSVELRDPAFQTLSDSLTYLQNRILLGAPKDQKYTWAIKKKKSGAVYCYPEPEIQPDIKALEENIITQVNIWIATHGSVLKSITYNPDDEKFLVIEINITPISET